MRKRSRLLLEAMPGVLLAMALPQPAAAVTFRLRPGSEFTFSARLWSPQQDRTIAGPRRWNSSHLYGDLVPPTRDNVRELARHVHFQRYRMLGINGTAPFPMAAFEFGSRNRFLGDRLLIDTDVFKYRYGGYRLTLPGGRGIGGTAVVLPSLGMSSRTTGADLQASYKLSPRDYAGFGASYAYWRRSSLPSMASPGSQLTNINSVQLVPSYEHVLPLQNGQTLMFEADAIYRSSVRMTSSVASVDPTVRSSESTRFDAGLTYYADPRLSLTAFVRNLTDIHPDRSMTLTTRNTVNPATVSAVLSEPRTFGLSLRARL